MGERQAQARHFVSAPYRTRPLVFSMTEPLEHATRRRLMRRLRAVANPFEARGAKGGSGRMAADPRARLFGLLRAEQGADSERDQPESREGTSNRRPNPRRVTRKIRVDVAFSSPSHLEREWLDLYREVEDADSYPTA